eukprot:GEMP01049405.1.p1 GENE.GEMP01049405.1~~GEMP01049405.1.p1  ORF type:complete len:299 (+),score=64.57 GEMP01049405.1:164-1060(+)
MAAAVVPWECVVCMDRFPFYAVIPCGHQALCWDCLKSLPNPKQCPICLGRMDGYLRIFPCSPYPWIPLVEAGYAERSCRRAFGRCDGNLEEALRLLQATCRRKNSPSSAVRDRVRSRSRDRLSNNGLDDDDEGFVRQTFDLVSLDPGDRNEQDVEPLALEMAPGADDMALQAQDVAMPDHADEQRSCDRDCDMMLEQENVKHPLPAYPPEVECPLDPSPEPAESAAVESPLGIASEPEQAAAVALPLDQPPPWLAAASARRRPMPVVAPMQRRRPRPHIGAVVKMQICDDDEIIEIAD